MNWKNYSHLSGTHAFLSPSRYHWINYSPEKLVASYENYKRVAMGTRYHALAADLIRLAVRLPSTGASFNSFVNDAIGFKMSPEVLLFYSANCYGTADAISFYDGVLRIHDLKTGTSPASINQLMVYAALFCLDYSVDRRELGFMELRIYQNEEVVKYVPSIEEVFDVVDRIMTADRIIKDLEEKAII